MIDGITVVFRKEFASDRQMGTKPIDISGTPDEVASAKLAGLRYSIPKGNGIRRRKAGGGFAYIDSSGKLLKDEETLSRIKALVIPPAWTSVWISPSENGHIQAVGRDDRGRKQYRYHIKYRQVRDLIKFDRLREFGKALPKIRKAVSRDLGLEGMPKRKIVAAVVKLLETTYIRVGNEEYVEENKSFGLTTLRNQHVQILGSTIKFRFKGKSHQQHEITFEDKRLAKILKRCKDIPGSSLFEYLDEEGQPQTVESGDVNDYLRDVSGGEFTAKDFRTWGGTCLATNYLLKECLLDADKQTKSVLVDVIKDVAAKLGNKPATCRKYYVHPAVLDCYSAGTLKSFADQFANKSRNALYEHVVLSLLTPVKKSGPRRTV